MTSHKSTPRRRTFYKKLRRVIKDTCKWLRRHPHDDAADRALTAIQTAARKGGR